MLVFVDKYPAPLNVRHCLVEQEKKNRSEIFLSAQKTRQVFVFPEVHMGQIPHVQNQISYVNSAGPQIITQNVHKCKYLQIVLILPLLNCLFATEATHSSSRFSSNLQQHKMLNTTDYSSCSKGNPVLIRSQRNTKRYRSRGDAKSKHADNAIR